VCGAAGKTRGKPWEDSSEELASKEGLRELGELA